MTETGLPASCLFAAAEAATALTAREFDWPDSPAGWALLLIGGAAVVAWVVWFYWRDAVELSRGWCVALAGLRLAVLLGLLVIALNPQDRTQRNAVRPSRVAVLVDTSLSMRHPASAERPAEGLSATGSRSQAVRNLLIEQRLLDRLQRDHEVSVYTFDAKLAGPQRVFPQRPAGAAEPAPNSGERSATDWLATLEPQGLESRLGEALGELIRQASGRTLSGIVVLTDGGQNAGVDPVSAHERAVAAKARLIAVGVGGVEPPLNLQVAEIQSPTDVQLGDAFDLTAFIQGQGLAGRDVVVEVLAAADDARNAPAAVAQQELTLPEDGAPAELKFRLQPGAAGNWKYVVRTRPKTAVAEFNDQDNEQNLTVNVFDRATRALVLAGGPMRDYQFVRTLLHRHKSIDVDVLLQTASVGTSQDSDHVLLQFPATREELYEYDAILAFDPDWKQISGESLQLVRDWVYQEGGGLLLVAGDVNAAQLAAGGDPSNPQAEQLQPLRELAPVLLNAFVAELRFEQTSNQPWPIEFTPDGKRAEFLQLTDDPVTSAARWKEFPGFYRCYPTAGAKAGATVLARFSDPRSQNEFGPPILLAEQFYGQGRVLYLGSPELWRLRAVSDEDYDRFWIKSVREITQGRSKRGTKRGVLLPEARKLFIGQTARIRARLLDAQFQPLKLPELALEVRDPTGKTLVPSPRLVRDEARPGEYAADFRVSLPGAYRLELAIPESRDVIQDEFSVALPKLEDQDVRQNVALLKDLVRDTGGDYVPLDPGAADRIAALLPSRAEPFVIEERLRTLWDRNWVMYVLVGLLSLEWLIRKLLKLA